MCYGDSATGIFIPPNRNAVTESEMQIEDRKSSVTAVLIPEKVGEAKTLDHVGKVLHLKEKPSRAYKSAINPDKCDLCEVFVPVGQLALHRMSDCDQKPVPCPQCDMLLPCTELRTHKAVFCLGRDETCLQCDCKMTLFRLTGHIKSCTFRKSSCPDCEGLISLNRRIISSEVPPCDKCGGDLYCKECWDSKKSHALKLHQAKTCPQRRVACPHCRKTPSASTLKEHLRNQHPMKVSEERGRILFNCSFWIILMLLAVIISLVIILIYFLTSRTSRRVPRS